MPVMRPLSFAYTCAPARKNQCRDRPDRLSGPASLSAIDRTAVFAAARRSLLELGIEPPELPHGISAPHIETNHDTFTASAADTPVQRTSSDIGLKSCLSSSTSLGAKPRGGCIASSCNKEFKESVGSEGFGPERGVCFSHIRVREYEVTVLLDDVDAHGEVPISLGWRYNPIERVTVLTN